ncbi:ABC transporter substrate-binding protein [Oceanimonas baumannii]|uniref:ABC transporter substrate-binding protein n=1 Tax=Oceanimonas baumannii TaxID=129578 RepID=UPI001D17DEAA|nr:ABC transporter substrate-binding protein [Oceanimonas baumannii]MCC4265234.1 ABC transporter substrate-binding protein [Oceanimonas baumannii]
MNKTSLILLLGTLGHMPAWGGEQIRIATEGAWPPFNYVNEQGEVSGFDVDIARALCARMQEKCEIVVNDWDGMIPGLRTRKFDAIVSSMSITEERLRQVDFTDKYYSGGLRFVGPRGVNIDVSPEALEGKIVGAQRSTIASQYMEDNLADVVKIKLYDNQENVYLDMQSGRLELFLSDELPTHQWLQTGNGQQFEFKGESFAREDVIGIAVRKGDPLRSRLNQALSTILQDGTYQTINEKYFPFSIY